MTDTAEQFRKERERLNEIVLSTGGQTTQRFFALDTAAYRAGALPAKIKELLGLTASLVLRCEDCVTYHLLRCVEEDVTKAELAEAMEIALVVGGSIIIPQLRRAYTLLEEINTS